jgi:MoaA/NifB/PqqE/SkfB family radical SAM enzyme
LMGGEPTLRRDLGHLIRTMSKLAMMSFITSNGTLLQDKRIVELFEAKLDVLEISLDGMHATPASRKTGDMLLKTIDRLVELQEIYDTEVSINIVITKQNYLELPEIIRYLAGKRISLTTGLYVPNPLSRAKITEDPLVFSSPADLIALNRLVESILRLKKRGAFIVHGPAYYNRWVPFTKELIKQDNGQVPAQLWNCDMGKTFLEVDCDGRVRYCSYLNGSLTPRTSLFDITPRNYQSLYPPFRSMLRACNARCLANCYFQSSEIRRHPVRFFNETVTKHFAHAMRRTLEEEEQRTLKRQQLLTLLTPEERAEIVIDAVPPR